MNPFFETIAAPTKCPACRHEKRANAIVCRDCWFSLPTALRYALPTKGPNRDRIAKLIVEYAQIIERNRTRLAANMHKLRNRYSRETFNRDAQSGRDRQIAIINEVKK